MPKKKKNDDAANGTPNEGAEQKKESKRDKFQRLAEKRMNVALEALRKLGQLSNRASYDYTEADVDAMFGALNGVITEVDGKYKAGLAKGASAESESAFSFARQSADVGKAL